MVLIAGCIGVPWLALVLPVFTHLGTVHWHHTPNTDCPLPLGPLFPDFYYLLHSLLPSFFVFPVETDQEGNLIQQHMPTAHAQKNTALGAT